MEPQQLGPYVLIKRLGRGGMGAVYEARHQDTGEYVAVKVLASHLADDLGLKERFDAEIQTLKPLRCPGIVQLIAYGEDEGQPYFAMELVHGQSLERLIRKGRKFTPEEVISLSIEMARSLKVAHDHGIIHRDLKPANLLVPDDPDEANAGVKLADFGIAKLFGAASQTAHGSIVGTAEFMAPEQAAGKPLDARADLYTLGLVMFTMIAGKPPFRGTQLTEIISKQLRVAPPRVSSFYHGIPDELDHLIDELLAKDPAKRPASALAVGRRLTAIGDMLSQTQLPTHDGIGDSSPSLIIQNEADPALPTNHDRSSSLTKATACKNAPQASPSSIDLLAETKEGTSHGSSHATDTSLDATTELPKSVLEPTDTGSNQEPPQVTSFATQHLEPSADEPSVVDSHLPLERRPTKQATSSSEKSTTSDADEDPNSTVVDTKPARRFITVEESERAAHMKNAQHRWQRIRVDTLVTAVTVVLGIGIAYWIIRPQSADQLFQTITIEMQEAEPDLRRIRTELDQFLTRYPADERTTVVASLQQQLRVNILESRMRRRVLGSREVPAIERDYRAALAREPESPSAALAAMQAVQTVYAEQPDIPVDNLSIEEQQTWFSLIERQIARLQQSAQKEQVEDLERARKVLDEASQTYVEAVDSSDKEAAQRGISQSRLLLQSIIETYADRPHTTDIVNAAKDLLKTVDTSKTKNLNTQGQQE
ncbi:MAG: serine/threonine-protein kinase [Pirellulales bacterium]